MAQTLHYPDLTAPPDWARSPHATQIRFVPPGQSSESPAVAIYLSPLLARHSQLPSLERLLAQTIEYERDARLILNDFREPVAVSADSGLVGICVELACTVRSTHATERRLYVMYSDPTCYYGITYIAAPELYETHLSVFRFVARSLLPFKGRVVTAAEQAAKISGHYND